MLIFKPLAWVILVSAALSPIAFMRQTTGIAISTNGERCGIGWTGELVLCLPN